MKHYALTTANDPFDKRVGYFVFHILPGLMLILPALWLAYNVLKRYYRSVLSGGREPFASQLWYAGPCTKRVPVESVVRFVYCLYAAVQQSFSCCFMESVHGLLIEDMQHAIVFASMALSAAAEVMVSCTGSKNSATTPLLLPPGVDRAASFLSAVVAFFVFYFHFHGEVPLQTHVHGYMSWLAAALVLSHAAEVLGRGHLWMGLVRPYVLFLSGAWNWQIAFILYFPVAWPRNWEDSSMAGNVTSDFLLCCHLLMTFVTFMTMAVFVRRSEIVKHRKSLYSSREIEEHKQLLENI